MEKKGGMRKLLSLSSVYEGFQNLLGARRTREWLAANYWKLKGGEKVVDIGCGPGVILDQIPEGVRYFGFDVSENYINKARDRYGDRGVFILGKAGEVLGSRENDLRGADLALCNGVLHHLDDEESLEVMRLAKEVLSPGGRLVCLEPSFLAHQGRFSKWIMKKDRGCHVRTEEEWKALAGRVFDSFSSEIAVGLIRIPYTHIVMVCTKEAV